jgi:hypothetical protein
MNIEKLSASFRAQLTGETFSDVNGKSDLVFDVIGNSSAIIPLRGYARVEIDGTTPDLARQTIDRANIEIRPKVPIDNNNRGVTGTLITGTSLTDQDYPNQSFKPNQWQDFDFGYYATKKYQVDAEIYHGDLLNTPLVNGNTFNIYMIIQLIYLQK